MATEYDAFTGGVDIGGLRTRKDIKVMLCYVLSVLDAPISKKALNEALLSTELVNFFEVNEALSVLASNGMVIEEKGEGDTYFSISEEGRSVGSKLETDVPLYVRDKVVKATVSYAAKEKRERYTHADIEMLDRGCQAVLSLTDGDTLMMKTVLYTADLLQAKAVCESFSENPEKLYTAIIDAVTH